MPEEVIQQVLAGVHDAGRFSDLVAGYVDITPVQRQTLLETLSVEDRLRRLLVHIQRQIGLVDAQEDIKSQVQEELGERQREMFLREQLKTIRRELGDDNDADDLEDLRAKLAALELPADARREVDRELGRLGRIARESMESQVIRTYLETILELPWSARSDEHLDLAEAQRILDEDHYALGDVKDRVLEFLAVRQLRAGPGGAWGGRADGAPLPPRLQSPRLRRSPATGRRVPSFSSSALRASARRRWPSRSPARWAESMSGFRWAAHVTKPTFAAIAVPMLAP